MTIPSASSSSSALNSFHSPLSPNSPDLIKSPSDTFHFLEDESPLPPTKKRKLQEIPSESSDLTASLTPLLNSLHDAVEYFSLLCNHTCVRNLAPEGTERVLYSLLMSEGTSGSLPFSLVKKVSQVAKSRFSSDETHVEFLVQDTVFKGDRLVLSSQSNYFRTLLTGGFNDSTKSQITIHEAAPESFEILLSFFENPQTPLPQIESEGVFELLRIAYQFDCRSLQTACENELTDRVTVDNAQQFLETAIGFNWSHLVAGFLDRLQNAFNGFSLVKMNSSHSSSTGKPGVTKLPRYTLKINDDLDVSHLKQWLPFIQNYLGELDLSILPRLVVEQGFETVKIAYDLEKLLSGLSLPCKFKPASFDFHQNDYYGFLPLIPLITEFTWQTGLHADEFTKIIEHAPNLERLNLISINSFSYNASDFLKTLIKFNPKLKLLNLRNTRNFDTDHVYEYAKLCTNLESLEIYRSDVEDEVIKAFCSTSKGLKKLSLTGLPQISGAALAAIDENKGAALRTLHLSQTGISNDGIIRLLQKSPNLRKLILEETYLTDETLKVIARNCRNLEVLKLNNITGMSPKSILEIFRSCTNITHVELRRSGEITLEVFEGLLSHCAKLTYLDISETSEIPSERIKQAKRERKGLSIISETPQFFFLDQDL